jgi:hypothetical protein
LRPTNRIKATAAIAISKRPNPTQPTSSDIDGCGTEIGGGSATTLDDFRRNAADVGDRPTLLWINEQAARSFTKGFGCFRQQEGASGWPDAERTLLGKGLHQRDCQRPDVGGVV